MNVHVTEFQRQQEDHKARQARLWSGKPIIHPDAAIQELKEKHEQAIAKLLAEASEAAAKVAKAFAKKSAEDAKRVEKLELDLADAQARILAQAEQICAMNDIEMMPNLGRKAAVIIIQEVLRVFPDVTWEDLKGVRREKRLVTPRQLCMAAIYEQRKDLSLPVIGRMFHRDHTTVLHAVHKIRAEKERVGT